MKENIFYIAVNIFGCIANSYYLFLNIERGKMLSFIFALCVIINVVLAIHLSLKAIRAIVREELENQKTKQKS